MRLDQHELGESSGGAAGEVLGGVWVLWPLQRQKAFSRAVRGHLLLQEVLRFLLGRAFQIQQDRIPGEPLGYNALNPQRPPFSGDRPETATSCPGFERVAYKTRHSPVQNGPF